jgi:hypothetical protein
MRGPPRRIRVTDQLSGAPATLRRAYSRDAASKYVNFDTLRVRWTLMTNPLTTFASG